MIARISWCCWKNTLPECLIPPVTALWCVENPPTPKHQLKHIRRNAQSSNPWGAGTDFWTRVTRIKTLPTFKMSLMLLWRVMLLYRACYSYKWCSCLWHKGSEIIYPFIPYPVRLWTPKLWSHVISKQKSDNRGDWPGLNNKNVPTEQTA